MEETRTESNDPTLPTTSKRGLWSWLASPKFNGIGALGSIFAVIVAAGVFFHQSKQTERQIAQQQDQLDLQRTTFEATERSRIIGILYSANGDTPEADIRSRQEALAAFFEIEGAGKAPIDLSNAILSKLKFSSDWNLRGIDLSGAKLEGSKFVNVDLTGASLKGAVLDSADFSNAILDSADLSGPETKAHSARFIGASLQSANLSQGYFAYAFLCGADMSSASANETTWNDATYDVNTKWPPGVNKDSEGATEGNCESLK